MVKKEENEKPTLQAVVVADHFNKQFAPLLSGDSVWSGVQLANSALINYTLEWLSRTEVVGVIVVVSQSHYAQVNSLLRDWSWRFTSWTVIQCQNCMSLGDALREVDSRALISGDFLLVQAGTICSDSLQPQIDAHRARRKKNKDNVMTLIYSEVGEEDNATRQVIGLEAQTHKLVIYHKAADCTKLDIDKAYFHSETQIRRDIRDSGIAICSPQICPQFGSNPDFEQRDDVVREILANEEVLCQNVHVEILAPAVFAWTIKDFETYLAANRFILQRWSFPLVPDGLSISSVTRCVCRKGKVYVPVENHQAAAIDRDAIIQSNVILGSKCEVKSKASIKNSAVGDNCVIDCNTTIDNCIIGRNVTIDSGCVLQHSIIADNVKIGPGCTIAPRCVLGAKVSLPADTLLQPGAIICATKPPADEEDFTSIPFI
uniref:EIF2B subunit epsilon/gamma LbH domain-containing protein n=1 Tax=Plectus sambesii TaxID=2011161 RepID=A0A914XJR1_9BILA